MKIIKYIIALIILVILLILALKWIPTSSDKASGTAANSTVITMSTSTDTGGVRTAQPAYVSVVPTQSVPKITYIPASTTNQIIVTTPLPGATVYASEPIKVTGQALGDWYFEATFPVILAASDGRVISQAAAQAQSDWMTAKLVPFIADISFVKQAPGTRGFIILERDNPSGLSQNDASVEIPVVFK